MISSGRAHAGPSVADLPLERQHELDAIHAALEGVLGGSGTAIVIEGEAGIGKSTLVRRAVDEGRIRGIRVLHARGGELEQAVPFGVVRELFSTVIRDAAEASELLIGPAGVTAPLLGIPSDGPADTSARIEPDGDDRAAKADPVAYLHGLFWLVLNLAERGPLAIVVDDAQWADEPSLRLLQRLIQRIDELPITIVVAMRTDPSGSSGSALTRLRAERQAIHLAPPPLTEQGVSELLGRVTGRPVEEEVGRALWRATRGNPFFVLELASELSRHTASPPDSAEIESLVPEGVGRYVAARLAAASPPARALAEAVAVLGDAATLRRAALLAEINDDAAAEAARWLTAAGVLDEAPGLTLRHPIVRTSIYDAIPSSVRASIHRRAGLLLAAEHVDAGVVGAQLIKAEPAGDLRVVELLADAADAALARGEPDGAVALLRRALAEPPMPDRRPLVVEALAKAEAAAMLPSAPATFAEAMRQVTDPARRAALRLDLGHALVGGGQWAAARDAFEAGLMDAPDDDPRLRARLEAGFLATAWITMEDRSELDRRLQAILASDTLGPANRELIAWIAFHQGAAVSATAREMGALVRRVFLDAPIEELVRQGQVVEVGAGVLLETDDLAFEVDVLTRALAAARTHGPIGKAGVYAYCRSWPSYYMGRLTDAIADAEEARRAAELGWEAFLPAAATVMAQAWIELDDLAAAEAAIDIDLEGWGQRIDSAMLVPLAAGRIALGRGDTPAALDQLRRAKDGAGAIFMRNTVPTEWRGWYATALLAADRRSEARVVADEGVEIARAWGATWPLGTALRVAGLTRGGSEGLRQLRDAEALLAEGPAHLEHARALVHLGGALRRNGSLTDAREVLGRAADLSRRLGARRLLARAVAELRAAGARPRRLALSGVDALTPAEGRVAREALTGRSNREIAQALFVTPKAVEFHLANIYRKLDIASRGELAGVFGKPRGRGGAQPSVSAMADVRR